MSFFYILMVILFRHQALMSDSMIRILRHVNPLTTKWNFIMVLWRSSQLYSCSFAYTFLSFLSGTTRKKDKGVRDSHNIISTIYSCYVFPIRHLREQKLCSFSLFICPTSSLTLTVLVFLCLTGTRSAYNAKFHDADLTMWSSFRVSNSQMESAWMDVVSSPGGYCGEAMSRYLVLVGKSIRGELGKPDVLTRWFAVGVFLLQFVCILVSCNAVNSDDTTLIFVTMLVCGLNIFLVSGTFPCMILAYIT